MNWAERPSGDRFRAMISPPRRVTASTEAMAGPCPASAPAAPPSPKHHEGRPEAGVEIGPAGGAARNARCAFARAVAAGAGGAAQAGEGRRTPRACRSRSSPARASPGSAGTPATAKAEARAGRSWAIWLRSKLAVLQADSATNRALQVQVGDLGGGQQAVVGGVARRHRGQHQGRLGQALRGRRASGRGWRTTGSGSRRPARRGPGPRWRRPARGARGSRKPSAEISSSSRGLGQRRQGGEPSPRTPRSTASPRACPSAVWPVRIGSPTPRKSKLRGRRGPPPRVATTITLAEPA